MVRPSARAKVADCTAFGERLSSFGHPGTVVAKDHACSEFHMEGASPAVYTLSNTELTTGFVAVFYQHSPAELSATFSEATAGALTPAVQVPARPCPAAAAGCTKAYEWGAIFATPATAGTYTWTAYKKGGAWLGSGLASPSPNPEPNPNPNPSPNPTSLSLTRCDR